MKLLYVQSYISMVFVGVPVNYLFCPLLDALCPSFSLWHTWLCSGNLYKTYLPFFGFWWKALSFFPFLAAKTQLKKFSIQDRHPRSIIFHHFPLQLKSEQLENTSQCLLNDKQSLRRLHVYHLISFLLEDSSLCHSIPITTCKKFLGMESHTFSSKEQNGMYFYKRFYIIWIIWFFQFRMAGKCFMEKQVTLPKTSELHSLRYFFLFKIFGAFLSLLLWELRIGGSLTG